MMEHKDMITFNDVHELCTYAIKKSNADMVNIIVNRGDIFKLINEFSTVKNTEIESVIVDYADEYTDVYYVSLYKDTDGICYINIGRAYDDIAQEYFTFDGYMLFAEDVSSRLLISIMDDHESRIVDYDWYAMENEKDVQALKDDSVCGVNRQTCKRCSDCNDTYNFDIDLENGHCSGSISWWGNTGIDYDDLIRNMSLIR